MVIWSAEIKEVEKLYGSLKGQLPDLEKELERLIKADDENMILLYSRRCLEVIITDLCECELKRPRKTEPLKGIIDKLHKEEKVPSHIATSMHGLNELSTYGAHPKDFDPEQVKPVLVNLDIIIKWYLKYKVVGKDTKAKPAEEINHEISVSKGTKKSVTISKNRLVRLVSGLMLLIATVATALFFTDIVGSGKQTKKLEKSIAVLPFTNLSANKENEYFSDGITDDILTQLSKIADLRVISRTSVMRYKGTDKNIREIGRELNVATILEGSIRRANNEVRIVAQLIDVRNDRHLWAETYDEEATRVLEIQSDVAKKIAAALQAELTPGEKERIDKKQTSNLTAYEYYLRGRDYYYRYRKEDNETAIALFRKALSLDPDYALAWAGLGDAYAMRVYLFNFPLSWYDSSIVASNRAIALDPGSAEAYKALGTSVMDLNVMKGLEALKKAIELNPNYHPAIYNLGGLYLWTGELIESIKCFKKCLILDPGFIDPYVNIGDAYRLLGETIKSEHYLKKNIELQPGYSEGYYYLALYYLGEGMDKLAGEQISMILKPDPDDITNIYFAGYIAELTGNLSEAKKLYLKAVEDNERINGIAFVRTRIIIGLGHILLNEGKNHEADRLLESALNASLKQIESGNGYGYSYYNISSIYAVRNKSEEAFSWLRKAIDHGWRDNTIMRNDPCFENLRNDDRFLQMTEQIRAKVAETRRRLNEIEE